MKLQEYSFCMVKELFYFSSFLMWTRLIYWWSSTYHNFDLMEFSYNMLWNSIHLFIKKLFVVIIFSKDLTFSFTSANYYLKAFLDSMGFPMYILLNGVVGCEQEFPKKDCKEVKWNFITEINKTFHIIKDKLAIFIPFNCTKHTKKWEH